MALVALVCTDSTTIGPDTDACEPHPVAGRSSVTPTVIELPSALMPSTRSPLVSWPPQIRRA